MLQGIGRILYICHLSSKTDTGMIYMVKTIGVSVRGIVRKGDKILILKRSSKSSFQPNRWELPGGKLDHGEELKEALAREVKEETSIDIGVHGIIDTCHFMKDHIWITVITHLCDHKEGEVELSPEHDEYRWVHPDDYTGYDLARTMEEQIEAYIQFAEVSVC